MAGPNHFTTSRPQPVPAIFRLVPPRPLGDIGGDAGRTPGPPRRSPVETALALLEGARPLLVWHLFWGPRPYGELLRLSRGITKRALRQELQALEDCGLLCKQPRKPGGRRAEYRLTPFGETLRPVLAALYAWGLSVQESRPSMAHGAGPVAPDRSAIGTNGNARIDFGRSG
jgi:DNA-binding HxlR family transcriptional regulator